MRKLRFIFFCGMILFFSAALIIYVDSYSDLENKADWAIVFGSKVHRNGQPSNRLKARLDAAFNLYQRGKADKILVSGGTGEEGHDEADIMAKYLIQKGLRQSFLLVDSDGYTTSKTAQNSARLIKRSNDVIAVTQQFHVSRAKLSLRNAGFVKVRGYFPEYYELRDLYSTFREVPAWLKYWMFNI